MRTRVNAIDQLPKKWVTMDREQIPDVTGFVPHKNADGLIDLQKINPKTPC